MAQRSMFFDDQEGDRVYTSDAWATIFGNVFSDGALAGVGDELAVTPTNPASLGVLVGLGAAWVQGRFFEVYSDAETLTLETAHTALPRIDCVVVRLDLSNREVKLAVKTGTPSSTPIAPALTQNSTVWEMALATVRVNAQATSVTAEHITDTRDYSINYAAIGFDAITVGDTTIRAQVSGDTLELEASGNITLTPDAGNRKLTVGLTDGTGSGLDADYVGGVEHSKLLRGDFGTYIGNDQANRAITLGYAPLFVQVIRSDTNDPVIFTWANGPYAVGATEDGTYLTAELAGTATGFRVSNAVNRNNVTYNWFAAGPV